MDTQEIETRQDFATLLRTELRAHRMLMKEAEMALNQVSKTEIMLREEFDQATSRFKDLNAGRGSLMAEDPPVWVYEYWLEFPGWKGPISGASAQLTMHGSLQKVGNVSSKSKSGLKGGIIGGLLLGPIGAAGGVLLTRKNEVKTQIESFDTRHVEFQISGPGYAWSTTAPHSEAESLRRVRDLINSRGSRIDDLQSLIKSQLALVAENRERVVSIEKEVKSATEELSLLKQSYKKLKYQYSNAMLPVFQDIKFRWDCFNVFIKWIMVLYGPAFAMFLLLALIYTGVNSIQPAFAVISATAGLYLATVIGMITYCHRHCKNDPLTPT